MKRRSPFGRVTQYVVLTAVVLIAVAWISAVSEYPGFLSIDISVDGISLIVDGR